VDQRRSPARRGGRSLACDTIRTWRDGDSPLQIHLILDNYATHNHPNVKKWLAKHPRFNLHFTPISSSWLNLVDGFFGKLTDKALRRGVFHSVPDLIAAIDAYLHPSNTNPSHSSGPRPPTRSSRRSAAASRSTQSPTKWRHRTSNTTAPPQF
jgi:hypothetical protein